MQVSNQSERLTTLNNDLIVGRSGDMPIQSLNEEFCSSNVSLLLRHTAV